MNRYHHQHVDYFTSQMFEKPHNLKLINKMWTPSGVAFPRIKPYESIRWSSFYDIPVTARGKIWHSPFWSSIAVCSSPSSSVLGRPSFIDCWTVTATRNWVEWSGCLEQPYTWASRFAHLNITHSASKKNHIHTYSVHKGTTLLKVVQSKAVSKSLLTRLLGLLAVLQD